MPPYSEEAKKLIFSNSALASIIKEALEISELPNDSVQLVPTVEREALNHLLTLDDYIHCIIPRGGEGLIRFVAENSRIPVIKHYKAESAICSWKKRPTRQMQLKSRYLRNVADRVFVTLLKT